MNSRKFIYLILILLIIVTSFYWTFGHGLASYAFSTYISSFISYCSILLLIIYAYRNTLTNDIPNVIIVLFYLWLSWNIFELVRGIFLARSYWDWKFLLLESLPFSFVPLFFFFGKNLKTAKYNIDFILRYLFPFGFLLLPLSFFTKSELYPRVMIVIQIMILFIPYIKKEWKILVIAMTATSVIFYLGFRSNLIKVFFTSAILCTYYIKSFRPSFVLKFIHNVLFILPIILLVLGITNKLNIFKAISENSSYSIQISENENQRVNSDTRTFLYREVFSSLITSGNYIIGEGASGGYTTRYFKSFTNKRYGSEVGFLNVILYDGLIGIIIYFLLSYFVSYYAIYKSNNYLSKMLGLFIAFRWVTFFLEDFTTYDLNFYSYWFTVGLVSARSFRKKTDKEIKQILQIKNYFKMLNKLKLYEYRSTNNKP